MSKTILIQEHLRPALPVILGCRDYQEQEKLLIRVDRLLKMSGVERLFVGLSLERFTAAAEGKVSHRDLVRQSERSESALRCTVLKNLLGEGAQKRRAQTEGRIGILKNVFLQGVPRAKGFKNRELQVDWAVLSHNLWVLARLPWLCDEQILPMAA